MKELTKLVSGGCKVPYMPNIAPTSGASLDHASLLPFLCFLCLTDVRHVATGSAPEMLWWEETQGSRGSLSYHCRYKRRLADAPEEKPVLVYMGDNDRLNKSGVAVGPYTAFVSGLLSSDQRITPNLCRQAKIRFWLVLSYALSNRKMAWLWILTYRKLQDHVIWNTYNISLN